MCVADDVYAHTKTYFVYSLFRIVYMYNNELDECVCWPYTSSFFWGFWFFGESRPQKTVDIFPCGFVKEIVKDLHMLIGS
jgi:hypothetical protein